MENDIAMIALMILRCDGEYVKSGVVRCSELEELPFDRIETPVSFQSDYFEDNMKFLGRELMYLISESNMQRKGRLTSKPGGKGF